jgi:tetratricopeptide (TPR) repeat protein
MKKPVVFVCAAIALAVLLSCATTGGSGEGLSLGTEQPAGKLPEEALLDRGILFATQGNFEMAIEEFTKAIELDRSLAAAYLLRGRAYAASMMHVIDVEVDFSDFTSTGDFNATGQKAGVNKAIADYTQALKLDPNLAAAYYERGGSYWLIGDYDRAIKDFNTALRLNPNYAAAYNNRGDAYAGKGDYDRAIADYSAALRIDPNDAISYYNRGSAYYSKRMYDQAIADYSAALRINPSFVAAKNGLELARRALPL